jgi:hypothetical protein
MKTCSWQLIRIQSLLQALKKIKACGIVTLYVLTCVDQHAVALILRFSRVPKHQLQPVTAAAGDPPPVCTPKIICIPSTTTTTSHHFEYIFARCPAAAGDPPPVCTPEIMRIVAHQHLHCPSLFTIFPMQASVY